MPQIWDSLPSDARQMFDPPFRLDQICDWVFHKKVVDLQEMTNLSMQFRHDYETGNLFRPQLILDTFKSADGSVKALFGDAERRWEAVWMPFAAHNTLCVSSQSGCQMGCTFCATATLPRADNLGSGEILAQLFWAFQQKHRVDRIVFMGMGEPFANYEAVSTAITWLTAPKGAAWSPGRITVSTAGLLAQMDRYWEEHKSHLAISLNGYDNESRADWMPLGTTSSFDKIVDWVALRAGGRRRITLEYILAGGRNDSVEQARKLARALSGIPVRVNLIPWNDWGHSDITPPDDEAVSQFAAVLSRQRITVTVRRSRALDIQGACGQLAAGVVREVA